jgi:hypothetical protein
VSAPRDLSCSGLVELDESLEPILVITSCSTGPAADPQELRSLRAAPGLVDDSVRPRSFLGQQHLFNPPYGEDRNYWKSHFVAELPDELVNELLARMVALGRQPGQVLVESLHGAPKNTDSNNGAVGFRQAAFNISAMAAGGTRPSMRNTSRSRARLRRPSSRGRSVAAISTTCRRTSRSSACAPPLATKPSGASKR